MSYIYKITNDINDKIYIGKTEFSIEKRFKEHCSDAFDRDKEQRPLYAAMRKYGTEHFHIELVEETNNPIEREIYWIEFYGSFKNGYNATQGGDGRPYADYALIYSLWANENKNMKEIHEITSYDVSTIRSALKKYNVTSEERKSKLGSSQFKAVACLDKDTKEILQVFYCISEAERQLNIAKGHISQVCKGTRKTAGGYSWKYLDSPPSHRRCQQ